MEVAGQHLSACFRVWIKAGNAKDRLLEGVVGGDEMQKLFNQVINQKVLEGKEKE